MTLVLFCLLINPVRLCRLETAAWLLCIVKVLVGGGLSRLWPKIMMLHFCPRVVV